MEIMALVLVFVTSVGVSGAIVYAFSGPLEGVIGRILQAELAWAWSKYARLALFPASLGGGLRLTELDAIARSQIDATRSLLEVFKSAAGCLQTASWTFLAMFGAALAATLAGQAYGQLRRTGPARTDGERQHAAGRY